jgi:predicted nucleic acid-binding protein
LRGYGLLTDDRNARRTARDLGIAISGTLGSLERLVEKEILDIPQADFLLQEMIRKGYRSPVQSIREIL